MNVKLLAAAAIAAFVATSAQAQQPTAPGQKMQQKGSVNGTTGASGYTPGHQMQEKGSVKGTVGASGYAPGHAGTTGSASGRSAGTSVNGGARVGGSAR